MLKKAIAALALCAAAGCSSLQTAQNLNGQSLSDVGDTIGHVNGSAWGVYVLWIPILTGSTESPGNIAVFQDTVNVDAVVNMVTAKSAEMGASSTTDLQSTAGGFWIWPVFVIKDVSASGNAIR